MISDPGEGLEKMLCVGKAYLFLYNLLQFLGWSFLLVQVCSHFKRGGAYTDLYESVAGTLNIFQTAAVLEIVHAAVGLVRSSVQVRKGTVKKKI